jgi:tetratricopeptide (TPR) repeat protein
MHCAFLILTTCLCAVVASADDGDAKKDREVTKQVATCWAAYYGGEHEEATQLAKPLLELSGTSAKRLRWASIEAAHIRARCYWDHGSAKSKKQAKELWGKLEKSSTLNSLKTRLKIAEALELESANDPKKLAKATGILEEILQKGANDTATAEAALDLCRLYVAAKRFDDAETKLKTVEPWIKQHLLKEWPRESCEPFIMAAKKALERLPYERSTGRAEFEAAEKLRKAGEYQKAISAYRTLVKKMKKFGDTDYAPRSELQIGHCLLGMRREKQAISHWEKFCKTSPAGPWRGQAYLELIDFYLERMLDLKKAGEYTQLARNSLPAALGDFLNKTSATSWRQIVFDLHLRIGIVSYAEGKNEFAATEFEAALQSKVVVAPKPDKKKKSPAKKDGGKPAPPRYGLKKNIVEGLRRLIAAAKAGQPLLPDGVREGEWVPTAATTALSMAMIYQLSGRAENAQGMLARLLPRKLRPEDYAGVEPIEGAKPEQIAFAMYCQARTYADGPAKVFSKNAKARELAEMALKSDPDAAWQDATLYLLATIVDHQAKAAHGKPSEILDSKTNQAKASDQLSTTEQAKLRNVEAKRLAALLEARAAALPYWRELVKRYSDPKGPPKSPYVEPAMYQIGVLRYELADAASTSAAIAATADSRKSTGGGETKSASPNPAQLARLEKLWQGVFDALVGFTKTYPASPYAGEAYVKQIDIALERQFDLPTSNATANSAVIWAKGIAPTLNELQPPVLPTWNTGFQYPGAASLKASIYSVYLRAGLIAYLQQRKDQAVALFHEANRFDTSLRKRTGAETSMDRMISIARGEKKPLTPEDLLASLKNERQKTGILLGDLALMTFDPQRAGSLYERLLTGVPPFPAPTAEVESYLLFRIGQSLEFQRKHDEAMAYLNRLYDPKYAKYPWTADGIFRIGTWTHNSTQEPTKAMKHWEYVFTKNPEHPEAERSLFYYGLSAMRIKDYRRAVAAFREYLKRYPDSRWTKRVQTELLPEGEQKLKETRK